MKYLTGLLLVILASVPMSSVQAQDDDFLDISIRIFTPASSSAAPVTYSSLPVTRPDDGTTPSLADTERSISDDIRSAEARYLSMYLRFRLEASGHYGAVRVMPDLDNGAHLKITGEVLESDGAVLRLALTVTDSTGSQWLSSLYEGEAVVAESLNEDTLAEEDFSQLFTRFLRDLDAQLATRDAATLVRIRQMALLRYGQGLVPDYFASYLTLNADGTADILRFPAQDDPLLTRISDIREREYLFIDVVDEEYRRFFTEIRPVYDMWRQFRREQSDNAARVEQRESGQNNQFRRGTYYSLQENYNNYRWAKLQEQYLDELDEGFSNETADTELTLNDSLFKLTGTMGQQYREWRSILAELLALELQAP